MGQFYFVFATLLALSSNAFAEVTTPEFLFDPVVTNTIEDLNLENPDCALLLVLANSTSRKAIPERIQYHQLTENGDFYHCTFASDCHKIGTHDGAQIHSNEGDPKPVTARIEIINSRFLRLHFTPSQKVMTRKFKNGEWVKVETYQASSDYSIATNQEFERIRRIVQKCSR